MAIANRVIYQSTHTVEEQVSISPFIESKQYIYADVNAYRFTGFTIHILII